MFKAFMRIGLLGMVLSMLLSLTIVRADSRSFSITDVSIQAVVDKSGNMHVTEEDMYYFDGAYNGILVDLDPSKSDGITDFQAYEQSDTQWIPLEYELENNGDRLTYRIYSASENEWKTFRFTYTVNNVVQVYRDTAELYWQFFDEQNQSELEQVAIVVTLPEGVEQPSIRAYGHGPLHGNISIENDRTVRYESSPLSAYSMLEVRILFPRGVVADSTRISDEAKLDEIIAQEEGWSHAAPGDDYRMWGALALLLLNVGGAWYVRNRSRLHHGWKTKYYRELPADVTPAVVGYLHRGKVKTQDVMATMMDLVRKKHVTIIKSRKPDSKWWKLGKDDYHFHLVNGYTKGLQQHEILLIRWFFRTIGKRKHVSLSMIRSFARSGSTRHLFKSNWIKWRQAVEERAEKLGYTADKGIWRLSIRIIAVAQFFGILFFVNSNWDLLALCAIPLFFLAPRRIQHTPLGRQEYGKWLAFRRFLAHYSRLDIREPLAIHLWDHYFVYAIPLGIAKRMSKVMHVPLPADQAPTLDITYSDTDGWASGFGYALFESKFSWDVDATSSSSNSSSDSDSGFSSGGGDGGGGGGRGAF